MDEKSMVIAAIVIGVTAIVGEGVER